MCIANANSRHPLAPPREHPIDGDLASVARSLERRLEEVLPALSVGAGAAGLVILGLQIVDVAEPANWVYYVVFAICGAALAVSWQVVSRGSTAQGAGRIVGNDPQGSPKPNGSPPRWLVILGIVVGMVSSVVGLVLKVV